MKKIKNIIFPLCLATLCCATVGAISLNPFQADAAMSVAEALDDFVMEEGAAVRKGSDKQGIRFNAILGEEAYEVLSNKNAEFGMLIVPKDYVTEGYELTAENVFGENAVYQANVKASEVEEGKKAIIQITEPTIEKKGEEYKIYGSLVGVLTNNIARGFIGTAYVYVDGTYYLADYAGDLATNNTRSMAYVAKLAVDEGDSASDTLQKNYINPVKDLSFNYTVNKVMVDFDGSTTKEVISTSNAQFATPVVYDSTAVFGFNGQGVNSFVCMENAEFNVVYTATPLTVVVDTDATATELYAAEELAAYITQVTGKMVGVSNAPASAYNNVYISTDSTLGLEADSFKLSTDANGNVHINGVDERGTLYGVYEYEEAYVGIKFLSENYTHVPMTNKQVAAVSEEKSYTPSFAYRTYMNNGIGLAGDANVKYSSHLRFISQFSNDKPQTDLMEKVQYNMPWMAQGWLPAAHSMLSYAAIGAWQNGLTDIVDYTVGADGKLTSCSFKSSAASSSYKAAFDKGGSVLDVCYSNATAKEWVKAGLLYAMENYPEMEYFMLGQADKRTTCNCTTCLRARLAGCNKSYLIANFVKEVANYVNAQGYSDKKIVMFAYQDTETAPPKVGSGYAALTDIPTNVYVQWAPVDSDRYFALDSTNIEKWKSALGMEDGRFLVWSYETDFYSYFTYYPTMQTWVQNFDTYKDLGVDVVMMQSTWNTSGIADSYLEAYVASKLLWNFEADNQAEMNALIEAAKSEFIEYFYGSQAKAYVEAYYAQFDALYQKKFASKGYSNGTWSFTEAELNALLSLLEEAIANTDNETYKNHLNMLALTPRYMLVKYCQNVDATLANDISGVATLTAESTLIANDANLQGLSFTKGNTTVYNVEYDENNRVVGMTVDMPHNTDWWNNAPRFTAEYLNDLYEEGVRYVIFNVSSTTQTNNFITYYGATLDYDSTDGFRVALVENGGELKFSYVDLNNDGMTVATTLNLSIAYQKEGQQVASEIGLTVKNDVAITKPAENTYTISNTNGMGSAYFSADQVNTWMSAGYDAISMNVSFVPSATITKTVCINGEDFVTMKNLLTDETGNATWTLILAEDTSISIWAQNGDYPTADAFTLSNVTLLSHEMSSLEYDGNNHWNACSREDCNYIANLQAHSYEQFNMAIGAVDYGCAACGYIATRTPVDQPAVDFTVNTYGATVYSHEWSVADATRVATTTDTLRYLVYHDNNNTNALSTLYLPKINFANFDKVTITVLFETFAWDQQYGLEANALTNVSDTWIDWASHTGTLTFEMVGNSLVMTLQMNGKTLTKTITDADIINGKASAYFCAQAYFDRYVTLSNFTFKGDCVEHIYGAWSAGSDIGMKKHTCTECGYEEEEACVNHSFGSITETAIGLGTHACTICLATEEVSVDEPAVDFTANTYGATVYSHEWSVADATRVAATTDTLRYLVYHDNNNINALSTLYLPKINFAHFKTASVTVLFETFAWNQQYGLEANALTNVSDTWIDWASHTGTLTFEMVGDSLVMTLQMNGKTLTKTITDADIINGKASAYFCAQAYYDRYITLSEFTVGGDAPLASDGRFTPGYATVTDAQYDENEYLTGLTINIPHNVEWSNNSPTLTQDYLNALYEAGVRKITFGVNSTATTNNFIVVYNGAADYNAVGATFDIAENAGDLRFSYVNLNNGGMTVATTLTLTFSYQLDPQIIANELGLTLASGVNMTKDTEGVYTLSNMNGYQGGAWFSADQVNAWIAQGYVAISMNISFTAGANIDTVVAYSASTSFVTDSTGNAVWTFVLKQGEAIDFWVQKNGNVSTGAFTLSNVMLQRYGTQFVAGYATVSNEQYDADGRLVGFTAIIPDNMEWSGNASCFTLDYLNALYAEGVRRIRLSVTSSDTNYSFITFYNGGLDYDPRDGYEVSLLNGVDVLKISYVNLNTGYTAATTLTITISYELDPQIIASEIGLTLASGVQIEKTTEGYTLSNMNGYQGGAWFSADQVDAWIAKGYTSVTVKVVFTKDDTIDTVVGYTPATGFLTNSDGVFEWSIPLTSGKAIDFWAQKDGAVSSGAFTITQVVLS